jgi:hypothetical protein
MCALADHPAKPSVVLDRELDEKKGHDPSGPRIRCPLCGWSPRKDDRWSRERLESSGSDSLAGCDSSLDSMPMSAAPSLAEASVPGSQEPHFC